MMNEAPDPLRKQIIPAPPAGRSRQPHDAHAALCVLVGSILGIVSPLIGCCALGCGIREFMETRQLKGFALGALEGAAIAAASWFFDAGYAFSLAQGLLVALGVTWCMRDRRATALGISAVIASVACITMVAVSVIASMAGSNIAEFSIAYLLSTARETSGNGIEQTVFISSIAPIVQMLWPLQYVLEAAVQAGAVGLGVQVMRMRVDGTQSAARLSAFRAPGWSVAVLAVAIIGFGLSWAGVPYAHVLRVASATVAMSVRFIFAIQGFGIMFALFEHHRVGCAMRTMLVIIAVVVEMVSFVFSVVGLVDVWANFRSLLRIERPSSRNAM
ncbi:hypothetical protein Corgl_1779 [Coriobacterium glomerans PW2]|uniref:DUF2232 domain-containing protein n=1 Tax=Coriobacterium glomerans (strain ATCC 49209 / DSM 20642 / JCM 10262 / PW2) TaxID=700015 RepID=F2N9C6_CORGP|nr:DUF2232 domain-containing protein [Coriobacterium glomerans]AEB07874.1 hypothetical protein Corgl_1779 [Coriobacterium glomerans PW2]